MPKLFTNRFLHLLRCLIYVKFKAAKIWVPYIEESDQNEPFYKK